MRFMTTRLGKLLCRRGAYIYVRMSVHTGYSGLNRNVALHSFVYVSFFSCPSISQHAKLHDHELKREALQVDKLPYLLVHRLTYFSSRRSTTVQIRARWRELPPITKCKCKEREYEHEWHAFTWRQRSEKGDLFVTWFNVHTVCKPSCCPSYQDAYTALELEIGILCYDEQSLP